MSASLSTTITSSGSISKITCPADTTVPSTSRIRFFVTVPEKGASTLLNIFITSMMKSGWPASKWSPTSTRRGRCGASRA